MADEPRHDATPPSGSARSAVEAPRSSAGRRMLLTALAFVILLFAVFMLIPGETPAPEEAAPAAETDQ